MNHTRPRVQAAALALAKCIRWLLCIRPRRPEAPTVRLRLPTEQRTHQPLGIDLERRLNPPDLPELPERSDQELECASLLRARNVHPGGVPR